MSIPVILHGQKPKLTLADVEGSNENLIVNGYFIDPINTKGQTEYTGPGVTIDRWKADNGCILTSEGIKLTSAEWWNGFTQYFEPDNIIGQTLTFSVLYKCTNDTQQRLLAFDETTNNEIKGVYPNGSENFSVQSLTFTVPESAKDHQCYISFSPNTNHPGSTDYYSIIKAAKLELGDTQTLVHLENGKWVLNDPAPNRDLELVKINGALSKPIDIFKYLRVSTITNESLDELKTAGMYYCGGGLTEPLTSPLTAYAFSVFVELNYAWGGGVKQTFTEHDSGRTFIRTYTYNNGEGKWEWHNWGEIYTTKQKPAPNEIKALYDDTIKEIDNISRNGIFTITSDATGTFPLNAPPTGILVNKVWDANYQEQLFISYLTRKMYMRHKYSNVWQAWVCFYDSNNKPTANDVTAGIFAGKVGMPHWSWINSASDIAKGGTSSAELLFGGPNTTSWFDATAMICSTFHEGPNSELELRAMKNIPGDTTYSYLKVGKDASDNSYIVCSDSPPSYSSLRMIHAGVNDTTAGSSPLVTGQIYLQYE